MRSSDEANNTDVADTAKLAVVTPFTSLANCGIKKKSEKRSKKKSRQKNKKSMLKEKGDIVSVLGKTPDAQNSSPQKHLKETEQISKTHQVKSKRLRKQKTADKNSSPLSSKNNQTNLSISVANEISQHLNNEKLHHMVQTQNQNFVSLAAIKQSFPSDVVLCALCDLPGNLFPGIGDLYGPYRPTYRDVMDRYDAAAKLFDTHYKSLDGKQTENPKTSSSEVCFDNNTCYITYRHPSGQHTSKTTDHASVLDATHSIHESSPRLHMLHTIDNILLESDRKRHSSSCVKKFHIPGVTGKIRFKTQPPETLIKPPHVPKINTMVFMEPTVDVQHNSTKFPGHGIESAHCSKPCGDSSSIQIQHRFDTSQIWVHSECAVWTPGVYAIGDQMFGLFESVRESAKRTCRLCLRPGASISCYGSRDQLYHHPCALVAKLKLNKNTLMIHL